MDAAGREQLIRTSSEKIAEVERLKTWYLDRLSTILDADLELSDIDFFYIFDRFIQSQSEIIAFIGKQQPPRDEFNKETLTFRGSLPNEIDNLKDFDPIPFFPAIDPELLRDIANGKIQDVMDRIEFKLLIIPDFYDADFAFRNYDMSLLRRSTTTIYLCAKFKTVRTVKGFKYFLIFLLLRRMDRMKSAKVK